MCPSPDGTGAPEPAPVAVNRTGAPEPAPVAVERSMPERDLVEVSRLSDAVGRTDGHRALGEHVWLDLVQGGRAGFAGFTARERGHGHLVGYAHVSRGGGSWAVDYMVHPHHRRPAGDVAMALIDAALDEVGRNGGGHVHVWVPKPTEVSDAVAAACGLTRGRDLAQMRRALPLAGDGPGLEVRAFRPDRDAQAWLTLNNRAFAGHPEQGNWDAATLAARMAEPWFDPSGFLVHEEAGAPVASCWTKVHQDVDPPVGEIYVVAVDPRAQGRGLGRAIVIAGLDWMSARGITEAMLYVDTQNVVATTLYAHLGFTVDHLDRAYVGDVAPIA